MQIYYWSSSGKLRGSLRLSFWVIIYIPNNVSNLKSKVDKLDIGKLETTQVDLSKLSNVVKNNIVKNAEYNELVKKLKILVLLILVT